ncbi:MAG: ATP-binding protein [Candidatus Tantalella remota]|nr:ATP-binding protein [Candidatus Tantalella remota]
MFIEPVFGKKFFGREEVLGTLQKRVTALKGGYRQNLALAGPMLAGKSSILRHFLKNIKDSDVIPLYIELDGGNFHVFCRRFMATLLYRYLKASGRLAEMNRMAEFRGVKRTQGDDKEFAMLKEECRSLIPDTVKCVDRIEKSLKQKKDNSAYEQLLSLTSVFKAETGKGCIVIFDEFQNLADFPLKKPFQVFGKFIMVQKNTMYIVSSSQKTLLRDILARKLSLLFGNFEVIEINGFDNQTSRSFIADKVKGTAASEGMINYIIQVSQGSPFYIEVLSKRFSDLLKHAQALRGEEECLLDTFAELLYGSDGVLNQYFTNNINFFLEKKNRKKFIPVLESLARGNSTIKEIQKDMGKQDKELGNRLQKLQEMDLVLNSGTFYTISDKLFEYWIRHVFTLKAQSMIDDMDIKYLEFKNAVLEDLRNYREFSSKSVETVVSELFSAFGGEKVKIDINCRKMPKFDSVKRRSLSDNVFQITGMTGGRKWICHVKKGDIVDERDVSNLARIKDGKDDPKISRKIFISLKGIEQNAYLLAKDQNLWVWDANKLNSILRLFGKFELVS